MGGSADKWKDNRSAIAVRLLILPDLDKCIAPSSSSPTSLQYEEKSILLFYRSNRISGFSKPSSSSAYAARVKGFSTRASLNQLQISQS